jgi:CBS domain-containing protein
MQCPACGHENIPGQDLCQSCCLDLAGLDVQAWGVSAEDPFLSRPLRDLPLKEPLVLGTEATVDDAVELMRERDEGCVFVEGEEHELIGVFTERDLAARVVARGQVPRETQLVDVMTPSPFTLRREDTMAFALHRMGVDGYRHVPVLDGGRLVGFLSMRTVLSVLAGT